MSRTYTVTGINLQGMPIGENDRLLTILTPEQGIIKAVAPGARKYQSRLRGRSELFVVNQLFLAKGRSLDKITQAETIITFSGLSDNLAKLASGQYLAELVTRLALSDQSQEEIYQLLIEHLTRLEKLPKTVSVLPLLTHAIFHILVISGIAPVVNRCCITQTQLTPPTDNSNWHIGFSFEAGGIIATSVPSSLKIDNWIGAIELNLLQQLNAQTLPELVAILPQQETNSSLNQAWVRIERLLRDYCQYHIGRVIRSATLVETIF